MSDNCVFCQIAAGDQPAKIVFQDDRCLALHDVNPQAPKHILVIPREHMDSLNDATRNDEVLLGYLLRVAARVANQLGIAEDGFRVVINTGRSAGQSVDHLHVHVLGGRTLGWPPG
ncbi:MAG: histidine triad nucleotide-binding protein [Acidobacteriota bacterium]